jgi:hypothetical protein
MFDVMGPSSLHPRLRGRRGGTTVTQLSATLTAGRFRQFLPEAALIEFGDQRPLQLVAFVEEGERKAKPMSLKISAFSAQVITVRGLITVEISPFMKRCG